MRYAVILNPTAGNGTAAKKRKHIEKALQRQEAAYDLFETVGPGHATRVAAELANGYSAIVAVGGDGTVQEIARGIISSSSNTPLAIIPAGTGNDFIKMFDVPSRPGDAIRAMIQSEPLAVDYGIVRWHSAEGAAERHFFNAVGIGFDAAVANRVADFKFLPGTLAYVAAVLKMLKHWSSPQVNVRICGQGDQFVDWYQGKLFLVTVGNGVCSGGGFYLTPDASVTDGMLNACLVEALNTGRVLRLMPKVLRGRHTNEREVHMVHILRLEIESKQNLPIHADGEVCTMSARQIDVEVVPGGLFVLAEKKEKLASQ